MAFEKVSHKVYVIFLFKIDPQPFCTEWASIISSEDDPISKRQSIENYKLKVSLHSTEFTVQVCILRIYCVSSDQVNKGYLSQYLLH